jgi:hypothetical protein
MRLFEFALCYVARVGLMTGQQGVIKLAARSVVKFRYNLVIRSLLAAISSRLDQAIANSRTRLIQMNLYSAPLFQPTYASNAQIP